MKDRSMTERKLRDRIRRYERLLAKEVGERGFIDDGRGKRYLLGPMYLQAGDLKGALRSFAWYESTFPDDTGEPFQYLCWTLALYKAGNLSSAKKKLLETVFQNLYLLPHLLAVDPPSENLEHGTNFEEPEYLEDLPQEYVKLWDTEALAWARSVYLDPDTQTTLRRYVDIKRRLKNEPIGPQRSRLVDEMHGMKHPDRELEE